MIEQYARVESFNQQTVSLRANMQSSGCHSCNLSGGCGTSLIAKLFPSRMPETLQMPIESMPSAVKVGDQVRLGIQENTLNQAVIMLYLIPLIGLVSGAITGAGLGEYLFAANGVEPVSIFGGLLGLSAGIVYARYRTLQNANALENHLQVLQIIPAMAVTLEPINADAKHLVNRQG